MTVSDPMIDPEDGVTAEMRFAVFAGAQGGADPSGRLARHHTLCSGLELFHDASSDDTGPAGPGSSGIALALAAFDGSYVSLAATPDDQTMTALGPGRVLRVEMETTASRPLACFLRLNLKFEEAAQVLHEAIIITDGPRRVDFDLAAAIEPYDDDTRAWVDIIFTDPAGRTLTIADLRLKVVVRGWPGT